MRYKIWDGKQTLITPTGKVLTPEQVLAEYPAAGVAGMKWVICDAPISLGVFMEFQGTKEHYRMLGVPINDSMTDQGVLDAITAWEEAPRAAVPSPEERMAAALEFQSIALLPDASAHGGCEKTCEIVKQNHERGLWSSAMVEIAMRKGLVTAKQCQGIIDSVPVL